VTGSAYVSFEVPLTPSAYTLGFYEAIRDLPQGSTVFVGDWYESGRMPETMATGYKALEYLLTVKKVKMVWWTINPLTEPFVRTLFNDIMGGPFQESSFYGDQFVYLGYIPGSDSALYSMVEDLRSVVTKDAFGTSLDTLAVTQNVNSLADVDFVWLFGAGSTMPDAFVAAWVIASDHRIPFILHSQVGVEAFAGKLFTGGQLEGFLIGPKGGTELEALLAMPGPSSSYVIGQIFASGFLIAGIVISNIIYFATRSKREE
jgi:hypothetical protein